MTAQPRSPTTGGFDLVGVQLGGFEIIERIRAGGMATLYLGRRSGASGFTRKAAIKVIHPHLAIEDRIVGMFVDEARICSQLNHPNIVHVEDFGFDAGVHFLAMEYIDGTSLRGVYRWLNKQQRPIAVRIATRIVMDVAAGLQAAHDAKGEDGAPLHIIHRDISPSNILLSRSGHIKIIDFGIAKARNRIVETESSTTVKGKLKYMAPEQATRGSSVDHRCDLFALGVVYWELLAGRELFRAANDAEGLAARLRGDPVDPPSKHNPDVPPALDEVVLKMLAFDPEQRIGTAGEIRAMLAEKVPEALGVDVNDIADIVTQSRGEKVPKDLEGVGEVPNTQPTMRMTGSERFANLSMSPGVSGFSGFTGGSVVPQSPQSIPPSAKPKARWRVYAAAGGVLTLAAVLYLAMHGGSSAEASQPLAPTAQLTPPTPPAPIPTAVPPPAPTPTPPPPTTVDTPATPTGDTPTTTADTPPTPTTDTPPVDTPPPTPKTVSRTAVRRVTHPKVKVAAKAAPPPPPPTKTTGLVRTSTGVTLADDAGSDAVPANSATSPHKQTLKHVGKTPLADSFGE
jgi:serine/threonine-protein kinase